MQSDRYLVWANVAFLIPTGQKFHRLKRDVRHAIDGSIGESTVPAPEQCSRQLSRQRNLSLNLDNIIMIVTVGHFFVAFILALHSLFFNLNWSIKFMLKEYHPETRELHITY